MIFLIRNEDHHLGVLTNMNVGGENALVGMFYFIFIIVILTGGFMFITDLMIIDHYESESSVAIFNAASESFGTLSLETISSRSNSSDVESRNINLAENISKAKFINSLKANLQLDETLRPMPKSFIIDREAIKIVRLDVVTSYMLPRTYEDSVIDEESLIVELDLPIELNISKKSKFMKIRKVISLETFLTSKKE